MSEDMKPTRVDGIVKRLKNNRLIAGLVVLGMIVIGVANFGNAYQTIKNLIFPSHPNGYVSREEQITTLFQKIHNDYIADFNSYLEFYDGGGEPRDIIVKLQDRNILTAQDRARLVRIVKEHEEFDPNEDNGLYMLIMNYLGYSDTDYVHSEFDRENIMEQRWRSSIKDDIERILSENWQLYFDAGGAAPLMSESMIEERISDAWNRVAPPGDVSFDMSKFKHYLIRDSIVSAIVKCQDLAIKIEATLGKL